MNRSGIYFFYSRKRKKFTVLTFPVEISEEATRRAEQNSYLWRLFSNVFKKYPVIYRKYLSGQAVNRCHSAKYLVGIKEGGGGGVLGPAHVPRTSKSRINASRKIG